MDREETIKVILEIDKETFKRIKGYVEIDHFDHDIVGYTMKRLADGTILNEGKAEDCISREAVLENAYAYGNGLEPEGYCVNVEDIQALPPVTPQEPRWIPVSERLPEDRREVLVTAYWHETYQVMMASYFGDGLWWCVPFNNCGEHMQRLKPKAWMPLPQPFDPLESEDKA